jgi:hypothetical protein
MAQVVHPGELGARVGLVEIQRVVRVVRNGHSVSVFVMVLLFVRVTRRAISTAETRIRVPGPGPDRCSSPEK